MEYVDYSSGREKALIFPGVIKRIQDEINEKEDLKEAVMQLHGASAAVITQRRRRSEEPQHTTDGSASCHGNAIITV